MSGMLIDAGWRGYEIMRHDPRWTVLEDYPRYDSLMQQVKKDVERQRAEVERIDAEENFMEQFQVVRRLRD